jgi:hypothetical protein
MGKSHSSKGQSRNDQRSNSKNHNNPAYKASTDNRSNQLNPNNADTKGESSGTSKK